MKSIRAKQRVVEVEMIQWDNNEPEIREFVQNDRSLRFPDGRLEIWNNITGSWINVPHNHYVVKGTKDELNTISPDLKEKLYEEVVD